jgi:membrane associated rhomboid family serine protease
MNDDDFALALQLQAEEDMLARGSGARAPPSTFGSDQSPPQQQWIRPHETFGEVSPMRLAIGGTFAGPVVVPSSSRSSQRDALNSDSRLAAFLQALEFEINDETAENRYANFEERELSSSSWKKQLRTISTAICIIQVGFLIATLSQGGFAPVSVNPMFGPYATTLVRYGAKYAALIIYRKQWWRLVSPMALHAGVVHLLCNVSIQLRVGGYLNLVYGSGKWLTIYLLSGIFGELVSCCVMPESVGVGSSGAIMGILASWIVWIVFRWNKIPPECHRQRNCQLSMVVASVVVTLMFSFTPFVDWGAHLGGALMGFLVAPALLSSELDNKSHAVSSTSH